MASGQRDEFQCSTRTLLGHYAGMCNEMYSCFIVSLILFGLDVVSSKVMSQTYYMIAARVLNAFGAELMQLLTSLVVFYDI